MEKIDLIWLNICEEMERIDGNLTCLMGDLHEFWQRTKDPEQKTLSDTALHKLTDEIVPTLNNLLTALENHRTK